MKGKLIAFSLIIITFFWYNQLIINLTKPTLIKLKIVPNISANQIPINKFSYPKLGILTPFSISPQTSPLLNSSWSAILPELKNGVSIAFETEKFNESTIIYITGHSSDNFPLAYSSVFAPLVSAKNGDLIFAELDLRKLEAFRKEFPFLNDADDFKIG